MEISIVIVQMAELFLMIGAGFLLTKTHFFGDGFMDGMNRFVLNVTMPCLIIASVQSSSSGSLPLRDILIVTILLVLVLPALAWLLVRVLPFHEHRSLWMFMIMYPNVGFMGFPLMKAIYGDGALLYTAIINMAFNVSLFTIGRTLMASTGEKKEPFRLKSLLNAGTVSSVAAVFLYVCRLTFPEWLLAPVGMFGDMTTPLAMMIIGSSLAAFPLKEVFGSWRMYLFVLLIDVLIPLLFIPVTGMLVQDEVVRGIGLIICAMPVANGAVLFARQYRQPELIASSAVCISTLLSIVTIPAVMLAAGL